MGRGHRYDLVVVGMGSGGMVAAELAASLPLRVAVVERDRVGGECLWTGCVPSKALLASARVAQAMRDADRWGLAPVEPAIDTASVWARMRAVQDAIAASDDSPARFEALGVELVPGQAHLVDAHTVAVGDRRLSTRFVLLCTGSRPSSPPVEGLAEAGFLTNESVFGLERPPASITMIGGGPIAIELAQAMHRLGVRVNVLERMPTILGREEPELVATLAGLLADEGLAIHTGVEIRRVVLEGGRKVVEGTQGGAERRWEAEELLVAAGRRPNVEGLGLEALGVETSPRGVVVDERMRTSVASVYAAGDVAGRFLFTHSAGHEAVRAVRDMFFPGRGTVSSLVPWCTFTDPELAHVGLTAEEARRRHGDRVEVHRLELSHSDRARADGHAEGAVVVVCAGRAVVGAHILAPAAGEIIHELALAVDRGMALSELASLVHVYPTLATSVGQLAAEAAFAGARRWAWTVRAGRLWDRMRPSTS
ncbi:MAG: FAD-dependent oxidoreductase [Actinomycetota bacterium]|jgi:pyruvate/2-oxoglutarate dehydrogenase complex dihydrolipoamide dehydrogenase (E3) component|nr:FAD-dependent oxidoreductase [Actinomycetota bacterium]